MLKKIFDHKAFGYVQLAACVFSFAYGSYYGLQYNNLLHKMRIENPALCDAKPHDFVVTDVKGTTRCLAKNDALLWKESGIRIQISLAIFAIFLGIPAWIRGDFRRPFGAGD